MASVRDSIVMLDKGGANELLGKGDCLVKLADRFELIRVQAPYISGKDIAYTLANCPPQVWNSQNTANLPPKTHKTSWLDKLLNKLGFVRSRPQRIENSAIPLQKLDIPYDIEEQNFYDCIEDDEEI